MVYRYKTDSGQLVCPYCGEDWTIDGNVNIEISIGGQNFNLPSHLWSDGELIDVDEVLENGYHSCTKCAGCDKLLIDMENVHEESLL